MELFAKGKRSLVYKDGDVVVKVERDDSFAVERIRNEAKWLKKLNKVGIGPRFIKRVGNKVYMEFVEGDRILEYAAKVRKDTLRKVLVDLLDQCRVMDQMRVNKLELTYPWKHVLVRNDKVVQIDFERCKETLRPKNVTQVCQFLERRFGVDGLSALAKKYKEDYSDKRYEEIRKCLINTL